MSELAAAAGAAIRTCQQREELETGAFQYSNAASELPRLLAAESQAD